MKAVFSWKSSIVLEVCLVLFVLSGSASGGISLDVTPPFLELVVSPGIRRTLTIEVTNTGDEGVAVRCFLADVSLSPEGNVVLLPEGGTPFSLAPCVTLPKEAMFSLEPQKRKVVPVQVRFLREIQGGRYGVVVFEAVPQNPKGYVLGVRTGVLLFLVPRAPQKQRVALDAGEKEGKLFIVLRNEGDTHVRVRGELLVRSREGKILRRLAFPEGNPLLLLPQGIREYVVDTWWVPGAWEVTVQVFNAEKPGARPLAFSTIGLSSY